MMNILLSSYCLKVLITDIQTADWKREKVFWRGKKKQNPLIQPAYNDKINQKKSQNAPAKGEASVQMTCSLI